MSSEKFVPCPHCFGWKTCPCVSCAKALPGAAGLAPPVATCAVCHGTGLVVATKATTT